MPTFVPPTRPGDGRTTPGMNPSEEHFWSHWRPPPVGVTVYKLTNGTYTETRPTDPGTVAVTYVGGHVFTVDDTEAASLVAAGYEVS